MKYTYLSITIITKNSFLSNISKEPLQKTAHCIYFFFILKYEQRDWEYFIETLRDICDINLSVYNGFPSPAS